MNALQFCEEYLPWGIKLIASSLRQWKFDTKITSEKIAALMKGDFSQVDSSWKFAKNDK